jgi:hypothetical protein
MKMKLKQAFGMFLSAQIITYTFITLLQKVEGITFLLFLVFMHGGILLFIFSKKMFHQLGVQAKPFYKSSYLLLSFYLPLMLYQLASYIFAYRVDIEAKWWITIGITIVAVGVSTIQNIQFYQSLKSNPISSGK